LPAQAISAAADPEEVKQEEPVGAQSTLIEGAAAVQAAPVEEAAAPDETKV